jgi:hypothetical protein
VEGREVGDGEGGCYRGGEGVPEVLVARHFFDKDGRPDRGRTKEGLVPGVMAEK